MRDIPGDYGVILADPPWKFRVWESSAYGE